MRKTEKRTISILAVQIFFLLFCFVILPDHMELLYDEHTPRGFHGDGIRHTIYSVGQEEINLRFIVGDNPEVKSFCITICDDLETEDEYLPDFEERFAWIKYEKQSQSDMLIMVYFPDLQQLHFFQKLI